MILKTIAKHLGENEIIDTSSVLPEEADSLNISRELLDSMGDNVYLHGSDGQITGKISRELLEFLMYRQRPDSLSRILDEIQDGVIAVDADGRIFYLNSAYTKILNVKPVKIIGKYIQQVEPESLLTATLSDHKEKQVPNTKILSVNKHVRVHIIPIYKGRSFAGAMSIFQDVTELHALNKEVRKMSGIVGEYSEQLKQMSTITGMGIITQDRKYLNILHQAGVVAKTNVPVLIRGENGCGKEVLANYIHKCSERGEQPFITVNCAAIPEELLESELFGYEEGSFTGAVKGGKRGKFELADKGTIFLDEIGDMPLPMQSKLLRVLQQGEIEKLGRQKNIHVDVRILAATNQPLEKMIETKKFRQDLFFRLNVFSVEIPPLRHRPDDIPLLIDYFLNYYNHKYRKSLPIEADTVRKMQKLPWQGNVRELQSFIERAVILEDMSIEVNERVHDEPRAGSRADEGGLQQDLPENYHAAMDIMEREFLKRALERAGGNRTKAAELVGLPRRTFYRRCSELNV